MAKAFEASQCVCVAEFRFKTYRRTQVLHDSALTRNAKLFAEIAFDSCDDFKRQLLHNYKQSFWNEIVDVFSSGLCHSGAKR